MPPHRRVQLEFPLQASPLVIVDPNELLIQGGHEIVPDPNNKNRNPVVIDSRGWVIDGRHRVLAYIARGEHTIFAWAPIY